MRIAQINMPLALNDGTPALAAHAYLEQRLCDVFGGFTSWNGNGAWMDNGKLYAEPVKVYQIAYDENSIAHDFDAVPIIAREAGRRAAQIAVFYVIDGKATIDTL